jgi:hypothetical protein
MGNSTMNMYFNTMVFTVISGIVSLMLLLVMFYAPDFMREYAILIITVEIGLLLNIIIALVRIFRYERRMQELGKNSAANLVGVKTCPDYWTLKELDDGRRECHRQYLAPDDGTHERKVTFQMPGTSDTVLLEDYDLKKLQTVCSAANDLGSPWTDVRSVCNAYRVQA